jgi:hypothetical protein
MRIPNLLLFLLPAAPVVVLAADFGSCTTALQCGFMCCATSEVCINEFCVDPSYVSSALLAPAATSHYPELKDPKVVSSALEALSTAVSSIYSEYRDVMTGAPMPSAIGTSVPSGVTIPSSLDPSSVASRVRSDLSESGRPSTAAPTSTAATTGEAEATSVTAVPTGAAAGRSEFAVGAVMAAAIAGAAVVL